MKRPKYVNRLSRKFMIGIGGILLITLLIALVINTKFIQRFYLRHQTQYIQSVGNRLEQFLKNGRTPKEAIEELENGEKVLIVYSDSKSDSELLSNELREKFRQRGLGFQKLWLWEQDYETMIREGKKLRIYNQDKLNYGILVEYLSAETGAFAIAAIIPKTLDVVAMINQAFIILHIFTLAVAFGLISILVKRITTPLREMEQFSRKIAEHQYEVLKIDTNDELEVVADSMNQMSLSIQQYQKMLVEKNNQMEQLLDNVAHDLKTPVSLIQIYAAGIQDGLDDGTFLNTIVEQNKKMGLMAQDLLNLSQIGQKEYPISRIILEPLLAGIIEEYRILAEDRDLEIIAFIEDGSEVDGNKESIQTMISNLISNAVKYGYGKEIVISLKKNKDGCRFKVQNEISSNELDLNRIWEPFYVGETSRNKDLSGTGLGLPIVKKIAQRWGYPVNYEKEGSQIWFEVEIKNICV